MISFDTNILFAALEAGATGHQSMREWLDLQRALPHWPQFENMMNANAGSKRWLLRTLEGDQQ